MPTIEFKNVTKRFGEVVAVKDLDLVINDGEYLALLGPSGCGKTTTLRMLAGLIHPSKGKILWDGESIQDLPADARDIGYVFQNFAIFQHLNVWDNVAFGPQVRGMSDRDIEDRVERFLRIVGLSDRAHVMPKNLGAADLQRIGVARVLAAGAQTLLLDEPVGALDQKIRERFQDELLGIAKRLKLTALHVTHDQSEAMAIADRIGVMKKGYMIQIGTPNDLLFHPSKIFTAHFIGESAFVEAVVGRLRGDHLLLELMGGELIVIPKPSPCPLRFEHVVIGIRREFLQMRKSQGMVLSNAMRGEVVDDVFVGEKLRTIVDLGMGRTIQLKRDPREPSFNPGDRVDIHVPPNAVMVFPYPEDGITSALSVT